MQRFVIEFDINEFVSSTDRDNGAQSALLWPPPPPPAHPHQLYLPSVRSIISLLLIRTIKCVIQTGCPLVTHSSCRFSWSHSLQSIRYRTNARRSCWKIFGLISLTIITRICLITDMNCADKVRIRRVWTLALRPRAVWRVPGNIL